jgi:hypothetical protein
MNTQEELDIAFSEYEKGTFIKAETIFKRMWKTMMKKHEITKEQALYAIKNGEFPSEVISSKNKVVVVMTQDWCPQWTFMRSWLYSLELDDEVEIYELIYNKVDYFKEFMTHKEDVWHNHEVPYLRYYKDGKLINESNYKNQKVFLDLMNT